MEDDTCCYARKAPGVYGRLAICHDDLSSHKVNGLSNFNIAHVVFGILRNDNEHLVCCYDDPISIPNAAK